jgi:hypothetical protein
MDVAPVGVDRLGVPFGFGARPATRIAVATGVMKTTGEEGPRSGHEWPASRRWEVEV